MFAYLRSRRHLGLVAALLLTAVSGCGKGQGEITGKVRYRNAPLPCGTIQFLGSDGLPYAAPIGPDGSYSVRVPEGDARVIVVCRDEARLAGLQQQAVATGRLGRPMAAPAQPTGQVPTLPQRYADWDASGLAATIEAGTNTVDFDLTD
jgi:hypothetical protein